MVRGAYERKSVSGRRSLSLLFRTMGCTLIRTDHGTDAPGVALQELLDGLSSGDELVIPSPKHVANTPRELLNLLEILNARGIGMVIIEPPLGGLEETKALSRLLRAVSVLSEDVAGQPSCPGSPSPAEPATLDETPKVTGESAKDRADGEGLAEERATSEPASRGPEDLEAAAVQAHIEQVVELFKLGVPQIHIARRLGISRQTVYRRLKGAGVLTLRRGRPLKLSGRFERAAEKA